MWESERERGFERATWHLHTMSASMASKSTTFPLPSSPHCAPSTTVTLFCGSLGTRRGESSEALSRGRFTTGSPFRETVSRPLLLAMVPSEDAMLLPFCPRTGISFYRVSLRHGKCCAVTWPQGGSAVCLHWQNMPDCPMWSAGDNNDNNENAESAFRPSLTFSFSAKSIESILISIYPYVVRRHRKSRFSKSAPHLYDSRGCTSVFVLILFPYRIFLTIFVHILGRLKYFG